MRRTLSRLARVLVATAIVAITAGALGGCAVAYLVGGMNQNFEYQKQIEVLPKYTELEGRRVAVVVQADMGLLYQFPDLIRKITAGVTLRLGQQVPEIKLVNPDDVVAWQWRTPQWNALPYGEICDSLGVDRVVFIDIYEYRLNPPGNQWLWEGVCAANVNIIESDGFDPDMFVDTFDVTSSFPTVKGVDRSGATAQQIEFALLHDFIKRTAWLFHRHLEPKYPDKFRPELAVQQ